MSDEIEFDRSATTEAGTVASLSPLVRRIVAGNGVRALAADGRQWQAPRGGYVHFG